MRGGGVRSVVEYLKEVLDQYPRNRGSRIWGGKPTIRFTHEDGLHTGQCVSLSSLPPMIHNNPYPHQATRSLDRSGSTVPAWLVCLVDEILQPIPESPRRTPLLLHAHHSSLSQNSQCDSTRLISTKLGARLVLKLPPHSLHPTSLSAFSVPSFSSLRQKYTTNLAC